jgi:hypothetical protein
MNVRTAGMFLITILSTIVVVGCGSSSSDDSGSTSTQSYSCCLNGTTFTCPSSDAENTCSKGDPSQCMKQSVSPDGKCN